MLLTWLPAWLSKMQCAPSADRNKAPIAAVLAKYEPFAGSKPASLLEVASGTGDWAAAQALAEVGTANWAALELRHDRVYDIFSRMVLQGVPNLAVIGGDAAQVLAEHGVRLPSPSPSPSP